MVCVSVILPTFNRAHSLDAALQSVLAQSFKDFEIIVVDDGSTQDIESVIRAIGDPRLRYIRREANGGAAAARNTGIAAANGKFIAFQDSDDQWLPGKLDLQMRLMKSLAANVGAVTGAKILCGGDPKLFNPSKVVIAPDPRSIMTLEEDQLGHLLRENRISVQNALFRRECYPGSDWFDPCAKANEDWEFAVRLAQRCLIFEHPEPVVLAFASADGVSRSNRRQDIGMLRIMRKNRGLRTRYRRQFATMLFYFGRNRWVPGKKRSSLKYMLAAIMEYPLILYWIALGKLRRAIRTPMLKTLQTV